MSDAFNSQTTRWSGVTSMMPPLQLMSVFPFASRSATTGKSGTE